MSQKNTKLLTDIEVFSSNALTRFISKQKLKPFGGDRRKYKYRVSLLNAFVDLETIVENLEAVVLGSSGKSVFESIQYLSNAKRQLAKIKGIVDAYGGSDEAKDLLNNVNESKVENDNVLEIIKDFEINSLNFSSNESSLFSNVENNIALYNSGDLSIETELISNYNKLVSELALGKPASSLEDVMLLKLDSNNLKSSASLSNWLKKWYGKAKHNINVFDETSAVRLDLSKVVAEALDIIEITLNELEDDLEPEKVLEYVGEIYSILNRVNDIMSPLIKSIQGSSFGDEFMKMIENNKLTDFPSNLSKKDKKSFQSYLRTREFKSLLDMYSGKEQ